MVCMPLSLREEERTKFDSKKKRSNIVQLESPVLKRRDERAVAMFFRALSLCVYV